MNPVCCQSEVAKQLKYSWVDEVDIFASVSQKQIYNQKQNRTLDKICGVWYLGQDLWGLFMRLPQRFLDSWNLGQIWTCLSWRFHHWILISKRTDLVTNGGRGWFYQYVPRGVDFNKSNIHGLLLSVSWAQSLAFLHVSCVSRAQTFKWTFEFSKIEFNRRRLVTKRAI